MKVLLSVRHRFLREVAPCLVAAMILCAITSEAWATKVHGRITTGSYVSTERFNDNISGSTKNDFLTVSSRFFLKLSDMGSQKFEFVSDLRDKNDFFDKLNSQLLTLDPSNNFQARQVSVRYANQGGLLFTTMGRFPVVEAGSAYTDGAEIGIRPWWGWNFSLFGGLDPKRSDQTYVAGNSDSNIYGAYLLYQPSNQGWEKNIYASHAFVTESVTGITQRSYFFENVIYQWNPASRFTSLVYLDFVPNTYIQTANWIWQHNWSKVLATNLSLLGIDVIEYTRRRGLLETLAPSPYKEASLDFVETAGKFTTFKESFTSGIRSDGLTRSTATLGLDIQNLISRRVDIYAKCGYRKNFVSNDIFGHLGAGYFSNKWEYFLDAEYAMESYTSGTPSTLHPITGEASVSNQFSRDLFWTLAFQGAMNETVTIASTFVKLGYRFGNQEMSGIRDGAPPRGRL